MRLANPAFYLNLGVAAVAAARVATVTVSNPVFVCEFMTPDPSLTETYLNRYRQEGWSYMFGNYSHNLNIIPGGSTGTASFNIQARARSARQFLMQIQNVYHNTVADGTTGLNTYEADGIAAALKMNLSELQLQAGSERFPQSRPINVTTLSNAELLTETERAMQQLGAIVFDNRFEAKQYSERDYVLGKYAFENASAPTDATRMFVAIQLARDPSPWSGIDLSLINLQAELNFDATTTSDRYIHTWLLHDSAVNISHAGTIVYS